MGSSVGESYKIHIKKDKFNNHVIRVIKDLLEFTLRSFRVYHTTARCPIYMYQLLEMSAILIEIYDIVSRCNGAVANYGNIVSVVTMTTTMLLFGFCY